jgi:hypothetical protein
MMSAEGPTNRLIDTSLNIEWQARTLVHLFNVALNEPDPDEWVQDWLEQSGPGDAPYVRWVMRTFEKIRTLDAIQLEICYDLSRRALQKGYIGNFRN